MSSTPNNNIPEKPEEETVEVIDVPENTYPSLQDGRKILGIPTGEFNKLYETCQSMIRDHQANKPTTSYRGLHNGDRPENHASFVLPIEKAYPVLRRCRDSWGVKWIIRKAKHAVAMKQSCANREKIVKSRKEKEKEKEKEKTESQSSSYQGKGITLPSITRNGFLIMRKSNTRMANNRIPDTHMVDAHTTGIRLPGISSFTSMNTGPVAIREPFPGPLKYKHAPEQPFRLPGISSFTSMNTGPGATKEPFPGPLNYRHVPGQSVRPPADREACDALLKESGRWLVSGPVRWDWEAKK